MESDEDCVYFAKSTSNAGPIPFGRRHKRPRVSRTSRASRQRRVVHFAEEDEDLDFGPREEQSRTNEQGITNEEAEAGPSRRSYFSGAPRTAESSHAQTIAHLSPSFFIPEHSDSGSTIPIRSTSFPFPLDMDGLNRARALKATIHPAISLPQAPAPEPASRPTIASDPETQLIKTLREGQRDGQKMSWADIASFLNQERRNNHEASAFTAAAVYSRYVRATPTLPTTVCEIGFDTKDYRHLREPNQFRGVNEAIGTGRAGKKRIKDYENAKELEENVRKCVDGEELRELETPERTEQVLQAVAKVERNFWVLVADEMERVTTRMYKPEDLARRYHDI